MKNSKIILFTIRKIYTMGCYFCIPNDKGEVKTVEADIAAGSFEVKFMYPSQRLYNVK